MLLISLLSLMIKIEHAYIFHDASPLDFMLMPYYCWQAHVGVSASRGAMPKHISPVIKQTTRQSLCHCHLDIEGFKYRAASNREFLGAH